MILKNYVKETPKDKVVQQNDKLAIVKTYENDKVEYKIINKKDPSNWYLDIASNLKDARLIYNEMK